MKPKVAIFDFASCEGCELQIANLEEDILELVDRVDIVSFREVMKEHSDDYDIAFIEGSIQRPIDEERLKEIRRNAKILVAYGDCAGTGCVNRLRNLQDPDEVMEEVYGIADPKDLKDNPFFDVFPTKAVNEVVDVDFYIRGCPVRKEQVLYYIRRLQTMPLHSNVDPRYGITSRSFDVDDRSLVNYNPNKCILCRRCDAICRGALGVDALGVVEKGPDVIISTPRNIGFDANGCIHCGQCISACSVGALEPRSDAEALYEALQTKEKDFVAVVDSVVLASFVEKHPVLKTLPPSETERLLCGGLMELGFSKVVQYERYLEQTLKMDATANGDGKPSLLSWCKASFNYADRRLKGANLTWSQENSPWTLLHKELAGENVNIVLFSPCTALKGVEGLDFVLSAMEMDEFFKKSELDLEFIDPCPEPYGGAVVPRGNVHAGVEATTGALQGRKLNSHRLSRDIKKKLADVDGRELVEIYPCLKRCLNGGGCYPTVEAEVIAERRAWPKTLWGGEE